MCALRFVGMKRRHVQHEPAFHSEAALGSRAQLASAIADSQAISIAIHDQGPIARGAQTRGKPSQRLLPTLPRERARPSHASRDGRSSSSRAVPVRPLPPCRPQLGPSPDG